MPKSPGPLQASFVETKGRSDVGSARRTCDIAWIASRGGVSGTTFAS
jgi:hypothetical protein